MPKMFFGKMTAYLTNSFCMAFVFLIHVVSFIDHYCVGVSNKHCLLSFFFHFDLLPLQGRNSKAKVLN